MLAREDYIVSLENENIMLREEIRKSKFYKEKDSYDKFTAGLTVLRKRETSNSRTTRSTLDKSNPRTSLDRADIRVSPLRDKIRDKLQESALSRKRKDELAQLEESMASIKRQQEQLAKEEKEGSVKDSRKGSLRAQRKQSEHRRVGDSPVAMLIGTQLLDESIGSRHDKGRSYQSSKQVEKP